EAPRAGAQITEEDEHFVERALVRVGWPASEVVEALQLGAEHVIEHQQMMVAGALGRLRVVANNRGVRADLSLGKHHAESHLVLLRRPWFGGTAWRRSPSRPALPTDHTRNEATGVRAAGRRGAGARLTKECF